MFTGLPRVSTALKEVGILPTQVRQVRKAIVEVYRALRDTRGGGYSCASIGFTAKLIGCSCNVPCLHAQEAYSRSDLCNGLGRACC